MSTLLSLLSVTLVEGVNLESRCFDIGTWNSIRELVADIVETPDMTTCLESCINNPRCKAVAFSQASTCAQLGENTNSNFPCPRSDYQTLYIRKEGCLPITAPVYSTSHLPTMTTSTTECAVLPLPESINAGYRIRGSVQVYGKSPCGSEPNAVIQVDTRTATFNWALFLTTLSCTADGWMAVRDTNAVIAEVAACVWKT
ncbi:hypothetical protein PMAYCL1PPCAC_33016 [Pristionchus mayeri]|uniref:Apple domain-containing protein n=1 Tax=Pristionchus mayeri TaxID=1317129 RepID=A0AAN5IGF2_9BILA|nr:hypothetical protein PMAYCL1PPCAC_33016 [Pristionchus mayeri]